MNLQQHPLSACFPSMGAEDFASLTNDIGVNGLRMPIVLFEDMVLDGWHRYQACVEAEIEPDFEEFAGDDPVAFVRSINWHRRHLTASQRAAVVVELRKWKPAHREKKGEPGSPFLASKEQMAKEAGVSTKTIQQAKAVHANGSDELKKAVREGDVSAKKAATVADLPKEKQMAALKDKPAKPEPPITVPLSQYKALEEKYQELVEELETVEELRHSDGAKAMNVLRESLRVANRRRDELMVENKEKQKQIDYYKRELKKLGWKQK